MVKITRYLVAVFVTLLTLSCSRQVFLYKTDQFDFKEGSRVAISPNDSLDLVTQYNTSISIKEIDESVIARELREEDLSSLLGEELSAQGVLVTGDQDLADYTLEYRDYWLLVRKPKLILLALKVQSTQDPNQGAVILCKNFDLSTRVKYNKEIGRIAERLLDNQRFSYRLEAQELTQFPRFEDVPPFPKRQLGITYGRSTGQVPHSDIQEQFKGYYQDISVSFLGLDYDAYGTRNSGIGIKTLYYSGGNNQPGITVYDEEDQTTYTGMLKDDIRYFFIGPSLLLRIPFYSYKVMDVIKICPGYLRYDNKATRINETKHYTSNTFSLIFAGNADFKISSHLHLGIEPRFMFAGFKKMRINGISEKFDKKEKLTNVEFGLVLKFN